MSCVSRIGPPKRGEIAELKWRPAASAYTALLEIITVEVTSRAKGSSPIA